MPGLLSRRLRNSVIVSVDQIIDHSGDVRWEPGEAGLSLHFTELLLILTGVRRSDVGQSRSCLSTGPD